MREIKFKYFYQNDETGRMWSKVFTLGDLTCGALNHYNDEVASIPVVAGVQYTGLKDKNGVEIYEGDVVEVYGKTGVIKYGYPEDTTAGEGEYRISFLGFYADVEGETDNSIRCYFEDFEVIGNIHENQELLKT